MARITDGIISEDFDLSVSVDRYQELMQLPINAFNGLNKPDEEPVLACSTIWKQSERDNLAMYLASAEEMREMELGYHLAPKYIEDEEHEYSRVLVLNRKHLIGVGKDALSTIEAGAAITLGTDPVNDPVTLSITTTVTDKNEICIFYPGETVKIKPSSVSISGGVATIKIPRARLVDPDLLDDRDDHLYYNDNDNFITTVDVKRCYTDVSDVATIQWLGTEFCTDTCTTYTQTACLIAAGARSRRISKVRTTPATYNASSGTWAVKSPTYCHQPVSILVSYKSGIQNSIKTELLTARLAHTLMPNKPSSCPTVHQYWEEDTKPEDTWTPYGNKAGAFNCWVVDHRSRVGVGGVFS